MSQPRQKPARFQLGDRIQNYSRTKLRVLYPDAQEFKITGNGYLDRVFKGKIGEEEVAEILKAQFNLTLKEVREDQDKIDKIDRIVVSSSGQQKTLQIKYRETGKDILVDVYEPFYGIGDDRTKPGRDFVSKCDLYACRVGDKVHLIHGAALRVVILLTMNEWIRRGCPFLDTFRNVPKKHLCYTLYKVLIHKQNDHASNRPKLLMFIPPEVIPKEHILTKTV